MREEVLETEAVEMPDLDGEEAEIAARPLPATVDGSTEVSAWRGDAAPRVAAAGGLVAGAATVAVVRATRGGSSGRKPAKRSGRGSARRRSSPAARSWSTSTCCDR